MKPIRIWERDNIKHMKVLYERKIVGDNNHNAFTDLCRYKDRFYLTYRACPDGHMLFPSSGIVVMRSADGVKWEKVHSFNIPGRDVRDPHFLVFGDKLFIYSAAWKIIGDNPSYERDLKQLNSYLVYSWDGENWSRPQAAEGTNEHFAWRTGTYGGKAYMSSKKYCPTGSEYAPRTDFAGRKSFLLESADGFLWEEKSIIQKYRGDETSFIFKEDGSIMAMSRVLELDTKYRKIPSQLSYSSPPYDKWENIELNERVESPLLFRLGDEYMAAGRWFTPDGTCEGGIRISMAVFYIRDNKLHLADEIKSKGDSSYPGFVSLGNGRGLLSYYSSHEGSTSVYIAGIKG